MRPFAKFQLFWWAMCCAITITYAIFEGWSGFHIAGATLYGALFIFEYVWEKRRQRTEKTWNQRVADGDI